MDTSTMQPKFMEEKSKRDQLQAVWFAAGMAVVIVCLERAVVLSVFKQWRVWVFLALNLLLIAILFTSRHPPQHSSKSNPPPKSHSRPENDVETKNQSAEDPDQEDDGGLKDLEKENLAVAVEEEDDDEDDEKSSTLLTKAELNERAEAFISRFRQQYLVSDVKISRSSSQIVYGAGVLSQTITV